MTRKDYVVIAAQLKSARSICAQEHDRQTVDDITYRLANIMQEDNPRFDRGRFYTAAGLRDSEAA